VRYRRVGEEILNYILREMKSPEEDFTPLRMRIVKVRKEVLCMDKRRD